MQRFRRVLLPLTQLQYLSRQITCYKSTIFSLSLESKIIADNIKSFRFRAQNINKMSTNVQEPLVAKHDAAGKKFYIRLGDDEAVLEYTTRGKVLNLWHTEVPPALQGKGIAKILAKEAFDHVVKNDLKMKLTCTYLQKYYVDNPKDEYKERVVS